MPAKGQSAEDQRFGAGRGRDVVGLVEQSARSIEIALHAAHVREMVEREREHSEGAALTRNLNASGGEVVPGVVGEQLGRHASGEPRPADAHSLTLALLLKRRRVHVLAPATLAA